MKKILLINCLLLNFCNQNEDSYDDEYVAHMIIAKHLLEEENIKLKSEVNNLKEERLATARTLGELKEFSEKQHRSLTEAVAKNTVLEGAVQNLTTENNKLKQENSNFKTELNELKKRLNNLEMTVAELENSGKMHGDFMVVETVEKSPKQPPSLWDFYDSDSDQ